ncbi:MAG: tRNA (guanosine(18)-2'-O)-methyltransferase TrmH [Gemmatimonadetes bacterium]|nr:MAG: tRNA (guanosine(18)-2'-O)-methyltransferase TrmH [Gemmatimonadota bacterium]
MPTPERFRRLRTTLARRQPDLTVLMEHVHKAHNLSAILRNADAVGVFEAHAVPTDGGLDISFHTSAGTAKWVPVRRHADTGAALTHLRERGFRVLAAHPGVGARDYRDVDYTEPVAVMVGAELHGLSAEALAGADERIVIPMRGMVQSLNVSVATALVLFEAARQREAAGFYDSPRLDPETFERTLFEWAHPRRARELRATGAPYPPLDEDGRILQSDA